LEEEYEIVCKWRKKGIDFVDKNCRRFFKGEALWSSALQWAMDTILLWSKILF